MLISVLDIILLNITSYLFGIATGLIICCKYKDAITRSRSVEDFKKYNHQNQTNQPNWESPVLASAPPPYNPVKLTIN
jgi:hypothetical protein